jgi:serine/threonine-protein kinase Chk2
VEPKKVRHSRLSPGPTSRLKQGHLPSPVTGIESAASEDFKEPTVTPPNSRQAPNLQAVRSPKSLGGLSSPPSDTQAFSQFKYPPVNRTYAVEEEEGYLVPMDDSSDKVMVLRRRAACPVPGTMVGKTTGKEKTASNEYKKQEEEYEHEKQEKGVTAGGYLIGRHRECGKPWRMSL